METLQELENSVAALSTSDYKKFRDWFWKQENQKWDAKIESDIKDNKLEALAGKALQDFKDGRHSNL